MLECDSFCRFIQIPDTTKLSLMTINCELCWQMRSPPSLRATRNNNRVNHMSEIVASIPFFQHEEETPSKEQMICKFL